MLLFVARGPEWAQRRFWADRKAPVRRRTTRVFVKPDVGIFPHIFLCVQKRVFFSAGCLQRRHILPHTVTHKNTLLNVVVLFVYFPLKQKDVVFEKQNALFFKPKTTQP